MRRSEGGLSDLEGLEVDRGTSAGSAGFWGEGGEVLDFGEDVAGCVHVYAGF